MHGNGPIALQALRRRIGRGLSVKAASAPIDGWSLREGRLQHEHADFFQIVGIRDRSGLESLLIRQNETALVGLLTARVDGRRYVLLNARAEPGLHGGCQFSSTIQSTPSNYERRHGGASTPHVEYFIAPPPDVRILHESYQYDWGRYYDAKVKRFLVVEIGKLVEVAEPMVWVSEDDLRDLLHADYSATIDLRIAALYLFTAPVIDEIPETIADTEPPDDVPLPDLANWRVHRDGMDEIQPDQRFSVRYVTVTSDSREVASWSQPLLHVADDLVVASTWRSVDGGLEFAVERTTQRGLRGVLLWHPFTGAAPRPHHANVRASAEGGRFLHHRVDLVAGSTSPGATPEWMPTTEAVRLAWHSRATSVEFRAALLLALLAADA
jgi:oxidase EvaA